MARSVDAVRACPPRGTLRASVSACRLTLDPQRVVLLLELLGQKMTRTTRTRLGAGTVRSAVPPRKGMRALKSGLDPRSSPVTRRVVSLAELPCTGTARVAAAMQKMRVHIEAERAVKRRAHIEVFGSNEPASSPVIAEARCAPLLQQLHPTNQGRAVPSAEQLY
jgi:hypothetical protein